MTRWNILKALVITVVAISCIVVPTLLKYELNCGNEIKQQEKIAVVLLGDDYE